jgi:hypothetical protein
MATQMSQSADPGASCSSSSSSSSSSSRYRWCRSSRTGTGGPGKIGEVAPATRHLLSLPPGHLPYSKTKTPPYGEAALMSDAVHCLR